MLLLWLEFEELLIVEVELDFVDVSKEEVEVDFEVGVFLIFEEVSNTDFFVKDEG